MMRIFMGIILLVVVSCNTSEFDRVVLRDGDILFRGNTSDSLSQAINDVTQTSEGTNYSHMGVVDIEDDSVYVIHASSENGVVREPLKEFKSVKNKGKRDVVAYRVDSQIFVDFDDVLLAAEALIGEPYNFTYILEDTGYYCSEFVYTIFEDFGVFELESMTFKSANSGEFPKAWIDHYKELGIDIPEGLPGCNPNGMANSPKLKILGRVNEDQIQ